MQDDLKQRLKAAGAKPADLKKASALIESAAYCSPKEAKQIEAALLYLCVPGALPGLGKEFAPHMDELIDTLAPPEKWGAWDLRALDLMTVPAVWAEQSWELFHWARRRIETAPKAPVWEPILAALQARGVIPPASGKTLIPALAMVLQNLGRAFCEKSEALTSAGRWMLKHIDESLDESIAAARSGDAMASLLKLLAYHRPAVFAQNQAKLSVDSQPDLACLIELLLETDAKRNEDAALKLGKKITGGRECLSVAENLFAHFKKKHAADIVRLLLQAMKSAKATKDYERRLEASKLAIRALGEGALPILSLYSEENDAIRLDFYSACAKLGPAALPLLIEGLVYPKDPDVEYGFTSHAKYVATMLRLLKPFDISAHHDRIEKAFAANASKKIQELIAEALGKKLAVKKSVPFDAKDGYRFDEYAKALAAAALKTMVAKKAKLPKSINRLQLACMDGEMAPWMAVINDDVQIDLPKVKHRLPTHVDDASDDPILKKLMATNGDPDDDDSDLPRWGDIYALPSCVLTHELIGAAQAVIEGLRKAGIAVAANCKFGWGAGDDFWEGLPSFEKMSRKNVNALPKDLQNNFAAMCFLDPKKQKWLLG